MYFNDYTTNRRVLVVDDHDGFRHLIGAFLSRAFDVIDAKNGIEAMGWLSNGIIPDAIVMDTLMPGPGLDSEKLLSNLRCSGLFCDIPVIVISDEANTLQEQHFMQLGAVAYLSKPFNPEQLQEQLERCIRKRPASSS